MTGLGFLFSVPGQGAHRKRFLNMSAFEFVFMNTFCALVSKYTNTSFAKIIFRYLLVGRVAHWLFLNH